jgi:hypothetical protein
MSITRYCFFTKHNYDALKNFYLNMLFEFFIIPDLITTHKFIKNNINSLNYVYYKIFQLTIRCQNSMILILHKTYFEFIKNNCSNKLLEFFIIVSHKTTHKFIKICTNILNYVCYNVNQFKI